LIAGLAVVPWPVFVWILAAGTVCFLALEIARIRVPRIGARVNALLSLFIRKDEEFTLTGASYFLIGTLVTVVAFPPDLASAAILFLALGDPAAAAVGRWRGQTKCWGGGMEGNLACLTVCLLAGGLMSAVMSQPHIAVVAAGAVAATVFQALPLHLNDNLTIPAGSGLTMLAVSVFVPGAVVF
jgi:dolichol kinase